MVLILTLLCTLLMLCTAVNVQGQALDRTHVNYTNPLIYGASCNATTLNAAIAAVGTAKQTFFITKTDRAKVACTWTLSSNVTFNVNTVVYIPAGTILSPDTGITVTFNGPVIVDDLDSLKGVGTFTFNYPQSDGINPYVISGCLPTVPSPSLILDSFACTAGVALGKSHFNITQSAATVGPLNAGNGLYWLILDFSTTRSIAGWTRQSGTHYLWRLSATQPATPVGTVQIAQVVVSGGSITTVTDLRWLSSKAAQDHIINVLDYGADPTGLTDSTVAFQNALLGPSTNIMIPYGTYVISDTISIVRNNTSICGAGKIATEIRFKPTSAKTLFKYNGVSDTAQYYNAACNMTVKGGDSGTPYTDFAKVAFEIVHNSEFHMHDVEVLFWHDTADTSVGIWTRGWELYHFDRVSVQADQPVKIDIDPVAGYTGVLDFDKSSFTSLYMRSAYDAAGVLSPHPCMRVVSKVAMFGMKIDGTSICSGDNGGIYWQETGDATNASQNITINNFRWEKPTAAATGAYGIYVSRTAQQLQELNIRDLLTGGAGSNGVTLTNCIRCMIQGHIHSIGSGVALSADLNDQMLLLNNYYVTGSTTGFNSMVKVWDWRTDSSNPSSGLWVLAANAAPYVSMKGTYFGSNVTDALDTYVIGNWTPSIAGLTTAGTQTYTTQVGRYVRIGRLVYVTGSIVLATTTGMVGGVAITGLPFAAVTATGLQQPAVIGQVSGVDLSAGYTVLTGVVVSGDTNIQLAQNGDNVAQLALPAAAVGGTAAINFTMSYLIP